MVSVAYPIHRLDWALFSVIILFQHWFPLLKKNENTAFILPHNFPANLPGFDDFCGAGNLPLPTVWGGAGNPSLPAGRGDHPCYTIYLSENFPKYMVRAQRIGFFNIGSGWVLEKIPGSGSASDWVGVLK